MIPIGNGNKAAVVQLASTQVRAQNSVFVSPLPAIAGSSDSGRYGFQGNLSGQLLTIAPRILAGTRSHLSESHRARR